MKSLLLMSLSLIIFFFSYSAVAGYDRNKAVAVEKVLFGTVISTRNISHKELIQDKNRGLKTFGGAVIGGAVTNNRSQGKTVIPIALIKFPLLSSLDHTIPLVSFAIRDLKSMDSSVVIITDVEV